jgi:hypothetical protein
VVADDRFLMSADVQQQNKVPLNPNRLSDLQKTPIAAININGPEIELPVL